MGGIKCVLIGCNNKAIGFCNNCRIPVCSIHGKKINKRSLLCVNCLNYIKKFGLRS